MGPYSGDVPLPLGPGAEDHQAQPPTPPASARSRSRQAATETAGVRRVVSATPSSRATGVRVALSCSRYVALIRRSPRAALPGATVAIFTPNQPPDSEGMSSP